MSGNLLNSGIYFFADQAKIDSQDVASGDDPFKDDSARLGLAFGPADASPPALRNNSAALFELREPAR
jgi:hypothetical protein